MLSCRVISASNQLVSIFMSIFCLETPESNILVPRYCSQNWTCELSRKTFVQCNAQAHQITQMRIFAYDCKSFDECYAMKKNDSILADLIFQMDEELLNAQEIKEIEVFEPDTSSGRPAINKNQNVFVTDSASNMLDEYALENYKPDKDEIQTLVPSSYNKVEMIDNGLTWSYKTRFLVKDNHLVICVARNEMGDSIVKKMIIPSEIERGRPYQVNLVGEREKDLQVVEGDNVKIQFAYSNILYKKDDYNVVTNPNACKLGSDVLTLQTNEAKFPNTQLVELAFKQIPISCSFNYSLNLKVSPHPYFSDLGFIKPTNPEIGYNLKVLSAVKPYFLDKQTNNTQQVNSTLASGLNETVLMITTDIKVDSDKTIELNCQASGRPKPAIKWLKDGKMLNLTQEKFKLGEGTLKLIRTHSVDSGLYECQVNNRIGAITRSFNIQVESTNTKKVQKQRIIIAVVSVSLTIVSMFLFLALLLYFLQRRENNKLKVIFNILLLYILLTVIDCRKNTTNS